MPTNLSPLFPENLKAGPPTAPRALRQFTKERGHIAGPRSPHHHHHHHPRLSLARRLSTANNVNNCSVYRDISESRSFRSCLRSEKLIETPEIGRGVRHYQGGGRFNRPPVSPYYVYSPVSTGEACEDTWLVGGTTVECVKTNILLWCMYRY
ncbi:hypothetical protein CPC08DRAFT_709344 [Agrocybe pediades]|nr:hypothetical protein CPC08DRAFT_709344 [Agrocybe pediades]